MRNPLDEELRQLQRAARLGDRHALTRLRSMRRRISGPRFISCGRCGRAGHTARSFSCPEFPPHVREYERVAKALIRSRTGRALGAHLGDMVEDLNAYGIPCPLCGSRDTQTEAWVNQRNQLELGVTGCRSCGTC